VLPTGAIAARRGGEEFVIYLPGASLCQSEALALGLRSLMASHDWGTAGIGWQQSASFGVAVHRNGASLLPDAVSRADAQLYEAKRRGRDQVQGRLAAA